MNNASLEASLLRPPCTRSSHRRLQARDAPSRNSRKFAGRGKSLDSIGRNLRAWFWTNSAGIAISLRVSRTGPCGALSAARAQWPRSASGPSAEKRSACPSTAWRDGLSARRRCSCSSPFPHSTTGGRHALHEHRATVLATTFFAMAGTSAVAQTAASRGSGGRRCRASMPQCPVTGCVAGSRPVRCSWHDVLVSTPPPQQGPADLRRLRQMSSHRSS